MRVYVNKKMLGRKNYPALLNEFPNIEFVEAVTDDSDIEVAVCMPLFFNDHNVYEMKNLKFIQLLMAGYETIDIQKLRDNHIKFANARDIFSTSIAEDVFTKIFYFNRHVKYYIESMDKKLWEPIRREPELTGSVIGILGVGSIGKEIAKRMIPFGVKKIIGYRNHQNPEKYFDETYTGESGLKEVMSQSDYLIVALPYSKATHHIINKATLSHMKPNALFINVGRGKLVKQKDLIEVLQNNGIRGAGLDVTDPEPLPKNSPLWAMENVFITPHNASSSPFMQDRLYQLTRMNLRSYIEGKEIKYLLS